MLRFLLNALLALLAVRFLIGVVRHVRTGGRIQDPGTPREGSRVTRGDSDSPRRGPRSAVDRSAVIDVPYTEVEAGEAGSTTAEETRGPEARA